MNDPRLELFHTLRAAGVAPANPSELLPDGRLHRHHVDGDRPGTRHGWHILHIDPPASGVGGSWKTGTRVHWCAKCQRTLTTSELAVLYQRIAADRRRAQAERDAQYQEAAKRGVWVWKHAKSANPNHKYLRQKGLEPGIARQHGDTLVLPVVDFPGFLRGVQYILPDGVKRFIRGMKKAGAYIPVGVKPDGTRPLWIAEGWATAATIQAMRPNVCVIAGIDAGNLKAVAMEARHCWPRLEIVICPDFDPVGAAKGREAALAARALILPPPDVVPTGCTDWNDYMAAKRQGVPHA